MPRVVHFEFAAQQADRMVRFYTDTFGWKIEKWEGPTPYWLVRTGPDDTPGINGGFFQSRDGKPCTQCVIEVPDVDAYVTRIQENGGTIHQPKMAVPGVGYLAYAVDTEGNTFGVMQMDSAAR